MVVHFILLFWYHVLTCNCVNPSARAKSVLFKNVNKIVNWWVGQWATMHINAHYRSGVDKYFWLSNRRSNPINWSSVKTVRFRRILPFILPLTSNDPEHEEDDDDDEVHDADILLTASLDTPTIFVLLALVMIVIFIIWQIFILPFILIVILYNKILKMLSPDLFNYQIKLSNLTCLIFLILQIIFIKFLYILNIPEKLFVILYLYKN